MDGKRSTGPRCLKRKLDLEFQVGRDLRLSATDDHHDIISVIRTQVNILSSSFSSSEDDRAAAKRAIHVLSELAKNEETVDAIVECGAIPPLIRHLQRPPILPVGVDQQIPFEHEVEKESAFTLGLLSIKPDNQHVIVDSGALPYLVDLLRRHKSKHKCHAITGVIKRAADAITNLAHENNIIKSRVRIEGGIPPLVELLEFFDIKVQKAAAGALRTLAFKNDENKKQIVECTALPVLVLMLHSEDSIVHFEAVGVIGNLVHSSPNIKKEVLEAGALQPVIRLLRSCCHETQREAALLLGQFATADSDCKGHIVQRGAVQPLIDLLESRDVHLKEMSAFALGRLAQDVHNQAGIAQCGAISPLLRLLDSKNASLQHNAAFALYGLSDNEDNAADFVKLGGVMKLLEGDFIVQPTKDCVSKTLKRLEEKIDGRVLSHLLYMMRASERNIQWRVVLALSHLCAPEDQALIFVERNGLEQLMGLLESGATKLQQDACAALSKLCAKASSLASIDPPVPSPVTQCERRSQFCLGEDFVNNPALSDVSFLVEGKRFFAHRINLVSSSDTFHAMFEGGYMEKDAADIEIPNIKWGVFEEMMKFMYTGTLTVHPEMAHDLLRASDQYLVYGLKRLCENVIAEELSFDNVPTLYEMSETYTAGWLRDACLLYFIDQFDDLLDKSWCSRLLSHMLPDMLTYLRRQLSRPPLPP